MLDSQYPVLDFFKEEVLTHIGIQESNRPEISEMQVDCPCLSIDGIAGVWVSPTHGVRFWFETVDDTKASAFINAIVLGVSNVSLSLHQSGKSLLVDKVQLLPSQPVYGDYASLVFEGNVLNAEVSGLKSVRFLFTKWNFPEEYSSPAALPIMNVDGWRYVFEDIGYQEHSDLEESHCLFLSRTDGATFTSSEVTRELDIFQKFLDTAFTGVSCCPLGVGIDRDDRIIWAFNQSPLLGGLLDFNSPTTPPLSHFWNKNSDIAAIYSTYKLNLFGRTGSGFLMQSLRKYMSIRHLLGLAHEHKAYDFSILAFDSSMSLLEGISKITLRKESPGNVRPKIRRRTHQAFEETGSSFPVIDSEWLGLVGNCLIHYLVKVRNDSAHMNFDYLADRGRATFELVDLSLLVSCYLLARAVYDECCTVLGKDVLAHYNQMPSFKVSVSNNATVCKDCNY